MKKLHFDHTKSYIEVLYEAYVRIEELEVERRTQKEMRRKKKMQERMGWRRKEREVVDIFDEDEVVPIGKLLKRKEIIEVAVQNSAWECKDKTTWMDIEWIKIRNKKLINVILVVPRIDSPIWVEQACIKPCSRTYIIHMLLEMEYLCLLLPNLEVYYLLHWLQICLKVDVALSMIGTYITKK